MKSIKKIILSGLFTAILVVSASAEPDALLTLRFKGGQSVAYQEKLFYVVREAVKTKPTVIFDVVSSAPKNGVNVFGNQVANDIKRIGVNPAQVTYRVQQSDTLQNEEVRIFVR